MLSIDAGGIAHMSFNYQPTQQTLETPGSGFASRGKGQHIRRIQVPTQHESYSIAPNPTPRSSNRAQLLAGLRTAPKTPTSASMLDSNGMGMNADHTRTIDGSTAFLQPPKTALGLGYSQTGRVANGNHPHGLNYLSNSPPRMDHSRIAMVQNMKGSIPTPPSSSPSGSISSDAEYEASVYAGLVAQNLHLAQQQQMLQQRLRNVQAQSLQRQFQQMQLQSSSQYGTPPISPAYLPNNAGIYSSTTYNSATNEMYGHQNIQSPSFQYNMDLPLNEFEPQAAANPDDHVSMSGRSKSRSPPAGFNSPRMSPPKDKIRTEKPLKRGHKKCSSLSSCVNAQSLALADNGPKTSVPKLNSTLPPPTPSQSTFGGRGDHPLRQPRGPPSLEEIVSKPTSKHEGSKNFATRQRRRALTKLVNAGIERRGGRSTGPAGSMASVSENEVNFVVEDVEHLLSHNGRHSSQGLRLDENEKSFPRQQSGSLGSTPLLVLSAAEKRKSALF